MLTAQEIITLIQLCQLKTIAEFEGFKVMKQNSGWEGDHTSLQAKLSIMLEIASRR